MESLTAALPERLETEKKELVPEYKKNPDAYKGSITDVCTIVRVAVTGKKNSPDLATIMNVIGKNRTIGRLDKFLAAIGK